MVEFGYFYLHFIIIYLLYVSSLITIHVSYSHDLYVYFSTSTSEGASNVAGPTHVEVPEELPTTSDEGVKFLESISMYIRYRINRFL